MNEIPYAMNQSRLVVVAEETDVYFDNTFKI